MKSIYSKLTMCHISIYLLLIILNCTPIFVSFEKTELINQKYLCSEIRKVNGDKYYYLGIYNNDSLTISEMKNMGAVQTEYLKPVYILDSNKIHYFKTNKFSYPEFYKQNNQFVFKKNMMSCNQCVLDSLSFLLNYQIYSKYENKISNIIDSIYIYSDATLNYYEYLDYLNEKMNSLPPCEYEKALINFIDKLDRQEVKYVNIDRGFDNIWHHSNNNTIAKKETILLLRAIGAESLIKMVCEGNTSWYMATQTMCRVGKKYLVFVAYNQNKELNLNVIILYQNGLKYQIDRKWISKVNPIYSLGDSIKKICSQNICAP